MVRTCRSRFCFLVSTYVLNGRFLSFFLPFFPFFFLFAQPGSQFRRILSSGTLIRHVHSAAQICCAHGNQDLSASCWSQCSSYQQQLAEIGCHILPPTPTSSSAPQVAPTLTTSWGPGQASFFKERLILIVLLLIIYNRSILPRLWSWGRRRFLYDYTCRLLRCAFWL